jgi:hypothetical protein
MQNEHQNILQHGESVRDHLFDLLDHLQYNEPLKYEWKIPAWVYENRGLILDKIYDRFTLEEYTVYHDCGKPYCKTIDSEGKVHFPNHAEVSYNVFKSIFKPSLFGNWQDDVPELILMDMDIHTMKADGLENFAKSPHAITLLIAGLAEIHSNAVMFGGINSVSFKIKWKQIDKRGKQVIGLLK